MNGCMTCERHKVKAVPIGLGGLTTESPITFNRNSARNMLVIIDEDHCNQSAEAM